jgi:hypothetical protein
VRPNSVAFRLARSDDKFRVADDLSGSSTSPVWKSYIASTLLMNPRMAFANLSGASIAA